MKNSFRIVTRFCYPLSLNGSAKNKVTMVRWLITDVLEHPLLQILANNNTARMFHYISIQQTYACSLLALTSLLPFLNFATFQCAQAGIEWVW